jgi:hypothetical protein
MAKGSGSTDFLEIQSGRKTVQRGEAMSTGMSTPLMVVKIDDLTKSNIGDGTAKADFKNYVTLVDFDDGGIFKEVTSNIAGDLVSSSMVTTRNPWLLIRKDVQYPIYRQKVMKGDKITEIDVVILTNVNGVYEEEEKYVFSDIYLLSVDLMPDDKEAVKITFRPKTIEVTDTKRDNEGKIQGKISSKINFETGQVIS